MTMSYKVGDKVRIVDNQCDHEFEIGSIVTITEINEGYDYLAIDQKGIDWHIEDSEIEPADSYIVEVANVCTHRSYTDPQTGKTCNYKIDFKVINGKPDWENAKVTGV